VTQKATDKSIHGYEISQKLFQWRPFKSTENAPVLEFFKRHHLAEDFRFPCSSASQNNTTNARYFAQDSFTSAFESTTVFFPGISAS
jgi:hypothetical protein